MKRLLLLSAAACLSAAFPARAQDDPSDVEQVIVTATRLPAPADRAPGAVVIDREDIETRGAVFAVDVLATTPGLSVFENGGFGGVASVRIRGASADKTLVLVDGVPVNDPSQPAGNFDFAAFDLADVERIEILEGPQGSLWGSDAIGGVVAFTTRELDGLDGSVEAGSYGTARATAAGGVTRDRWALGLSAAGLTSGGISKADEDDGNPERDGLDSWAVSGSGRLQPADGLRFDARLRISDSRTEVDGFAPPLFTLGDTPELAKSRSSSGLLRATADGPFDFEHQLSFSGYRIERSQTGGIPFRYDADRQVWRWQATRANAGEPWSLALGAERETLQARLSDGTRQDAGATSAFAVLRVQPAPRLSLTGSLRWDDPQDYQAVTTGRASAVFDAGAGIRLEVSWGQGFKTPTISQTACDFCFPAGPAVDLKPERAEGWDAGLRWRSADGRLQGRIGGWRLSVHDQIDFVFDPLTFDFRYQNIAETLSTGWTAEGEWEIGGGFALSANWTSTDAVDRGTGARLLRVPGAQGAAILTWTGRRGRAALTVRGESDQADAGGTRNGFVTADFAGGWRLNDRVEATLRVQNLTDANYQEVLGYGEPGRSAYVGLRLRY